MILTVTWMQQMNPSRLSATTYTATTLSIEMALKPASTSGKSVDSTAPAKTTPTFDSSVQVHSFVFFYAVIFCTLLST